MRTIMKHHYSVLIWTLCASSLLLQGCFPLYRASIPNQPIMKQKGDIEISAGIETGSAFVEGSYAITDFAYATVGGLSWTNNNSSAYFAEGGIGFYQTKDKNGFSFSALGGYGESSALNNWWSTSTVNFIETSAISTRYARISIQPSYYFHRPYIDFAMIFRNSFVNWLSPETVGTDRPGIDIFFEPTLAFRAGPPNTKFFFDAGLQVPAFRSFSHYNAPFHLAVGVDVIFQKRK